MTQQHDAAPPSDQSIRPWLHIHPRHGWLNDPNGLSRIDGRYHVFYQHNPDGPRHTNIHWAHVSSSDLIRWSEEPIALAPEAGTINQQGCWSGCVVDDAGVPTAVYTAVHDGPDNAVVGLARSDRTLRTWTADPVGKIGNPDDPGVSQVRDPFVFTLDGRRYAVQGAGQPTGSPQLLLYSCDDLDSWTFLGPLLTYDDPIAAEVAPANIWECPNLFRLGERWVIILSLWRDASGFHQLCGVRYLIGDLVPAGDGLRFVTRGGGSVDDGATFYAPQVLVEPGRVLLWGWAWEGLDRSASAIEAAGWAGTLTFPRELGLADDRLVSRPAAELAGLRTGRLLPGADGVIAANAFEVVADGPVELALADPEQGTRVVVAQTTGAARLFVDGSIVEVFGTGPSLTSRHYPTATSHWELRSAADCQVWALG
ncbi:MAG: glycoside hydrolase family 32 protein [Micropruina sp.]|uniref:glycoside hydrolase family 32 protein n=1 Tax=Micropruina sp. TaxID=2737536 RepID=UPI0039E64E07